MAVEALRAALKTAPGAEVRSLIFGATAAPYLEKLNAAIVGAAAQLPAHAPALNPVE
jgi:3-hydroxy-3-methylglutaryl CoA synthase